MSVSEYKNIHKGERVFILGNGPSLDETPLDLIKDEYSIAMNSIDLLYDETEWRPTYYINVMGIGDNSFTKEYIDIFIRTPMISANKGIDCFFYSDLKDYFPERENIHYLNRIELTHTSKLEMRKKIGDCDLDGIWSRDLEQCVYRKHTSIYSAAQLADYMGFDEIYFIGVDLYPVFKPWPVKIFDDGPHTQKYIDFSSGGKLSYLFEDGKPIKSIINGFSHYGLNNETFMGFLFKLKKLLRGAENHHFGDKYPDRELYTYPKNYKLRQTHKIIEMIGEIQGFDVFNATNGGKLEVHKRVTLQEVV